VLKITENLASLHAKFEIFQAITITYQHVYIYRLYVSLRGLIWQFNVNGKLIKKITIKLALKLVPINFYWHQINIILKWLKVHVLKKKTQQHISNNNYKIM
jgi:hypothetical protein